VRLSLVVLTTFVAGAASAYGAEAPAASQDPLAPVMAKIALGETGNDPDAYRALYGGGHFGFPQWEGRAGPAGISHAAGKYEFQPGTWKLAATEYIAAGNPAPDFAVPADQEAVARFWARRTYKKNTGRDLVDDAAKGTVNYSALAGEWSSLGRPRHHAGSFRSAAARVSSESKGGVDALLKQQREVQTNPFITPGHSAPEMVFNVEKR